MVVEERKENVGRDSKGVRGIGRGKGRQPNRATIKCFKCRKLGHYKNECPEWDKEANYVEFNDEEEMLLMTINEGKEKKEKNCLVFGF